jgi:hypothetical protein
MKHMIPHSVVEAVDAFLEAAADPAKDPRTWRVDSYIDRGISKLPNFSDDVGKLMDWFMSTYGQELTDEEWKIVATEIQSFVDQLEGGEGDSSFASLREIADGFFDDKPEFSLLSFEVTEGGERIECWIKSNKPISTDELRPVVYDLSYRLGDDTGEQYLCLISTKGSKGRCVLRVLK